MNDYASAGLLGMLTPQANTTVEAELWTLLPPNWSMLNARLTSTHARMHDRLTEYAAGLSTACTQFANAPISNIGFACTGASYLIGKERERILLEKVEQQHQIACWTSALAVKAALNALDATTLALISPYADDLTAASVDYWQSHEFIVANVTCPTTSDSAHHPIYGMHVDAARQTLLSIKDNAADAIVLLGTGMPTLSALVAAKMWDGPPVISCNLALAWATTQSTPSAGVSGGDTKPSLNTTSLRAWLRAAPWQPRYELLFPSSQ